MKQIEPELVTVDQAETMTAISKWTWRRWAYDGKIASVKLGRRLLIPVAEIRRVIAENTRPALSETGQRAIEDFRKWSDVRERAITYDKTDEWEERQDAAKRK